MAKSRLFIFIDWLADNGRGPISQPLVPDWLRARRVMNTIWTWIERNSYRNSFSKQILI